MQSVIVIGGGASGLMAAYELSKHKISVTVLEAKSRLGGRILTITEPFSQAVELGAEFIHGDLPHTLSLCDEAGAVYHKITGKMYTLEKGNYKKERHFSEHWNLLIKQMHALKQDMPLADFLQTYFDDKKYDDLRNSVRGFAGGFDLADVSTASTKGLYNEWSKEEGDQYRINGGYKLLIDYLEMQCKKNGCIIQTNCCVKKISWQQNDVNILTMCSRLFKSNKIIISVPVSVLQVENNDENYIEFEPSIPEHLTAAKNIGFGLVIKILLEFTENFWNKEKQDAGFFFIDEAEVPTWWTQLPVENNILTGWIGNEKSNSLKDNTDEMILDTALQSLANGFDISKTQLQLKLKASKIVNWYKIPDINGGYTFNTLKSVEAKKILHQPVNDTIFFTGEALYDSTPFGTVEAALASAKQTAAKILKTL
jgi:monoamine oxidase